jgi:hypothetical protein
MHHGKASTSSTSGISNEMSGNGEQPTQVVGVFNDKGLQYVYYPRRHTTNVRRYLEMMRTTVENQLRQAIDKHKIVRWYIGISVNFNRPPDENTRPPPWFNSNAYLYMEVNVDPNKSYN